MRKRLWAIHITWVILCVTAFGICEWGGRRGLPGLQFTVVPWLHRVQSSLRDLKFNVRGYRPVTKPIVLVDIDDASLAQIGRWPWRRDDLTALIHSVFQRGAAAVALDIVFSEPQESVPEELREMLKMRKLSNLLVDFDFDAKLTALFRRYRERLVTPWVSQFLCQPAWSKPEECPVSDPDLLAALPAGFEKFALLNVEKEPGFDRGKTVLRSTPHVTANLDMLNAVTLYSGAANSDAATDGDGLIRRAPAFIMVGEHLQPSADLQMAMLARKEGVRIKLSKDGLVSSMTWEKTGKRIPVTSGGLFNINFRGPWQHFKTVRATTLFEDEPSRELASQNRSVFENALVIVGVSARAVGDLRPTPFDPSLPGMEVRANILENLVTDTLIDTGTNTVIIFLFLWMIAAGGLVVWVGQRWEAIPAIAFCAGLGAVSVFADLRLFFVNLDLNTGFWYAQMLGSFGITVAGRYIIEQKDKKFVRSAFSKYVAPAVVDSILKDPKSLSLGGRRETLTILFSDIRGFTSLSEKLDAKAVAEFLNDYLSVQTEIVFEHGGTLDKYIGDAVMAFWGAPLGQPDHAARACRAALMMAEKLESNRDRYLSKYGITVNMGVGVHTGEVSVGNMGSSRSFSYTVIGDAVNLASRLEGATKHFGAEILTTRFTLDNIGESGEPLPPNRKIADVKVKGKRRVVEVHELIRGHRDPQGLAMFEQGVKLYVAKDFKQAMKCFQDSQKSLGDVTSKHYLELCRHYASEGVPADWDGSLSLTEK